MFEFIFCHSFSFLFFTCFQFYLHFLCVSFTFSFHFFSISPPVVVPLLRAPNIFTSKKVPNQSFFFFFFLHFSLFRYSVFLFFSQFFNFLGGEIVDLFFYFRFWAHPPDVMPWMACGQQLRVETQHRTPSQSVRMRGEATMSSVTAMLTRPPSIHTLGVVGGRGTPRWDDRADTLNPNT